MTSMPGEWEEDEDVEPETASSKAKGKGRAAYDEPAETAAKAAGGKKRRRGADRRCPNEGTRSRATSEAGGGTENSKE